MGVGIAVDCGDRGYPHCRPRSSEPKSSSRLQRMDWAPSPQGRVRGAHGRHDLVSYSPAQDRSSHLGSAYQLLGSLPDLRSSVLYSLIAMTSYRSHKSVPRRALAVGELVKISRISWLERRHRPGRLGKDQKITHDLPCATFCHSVAVPASVREIARVSLPRLQVRGYLFFVSC